MKASLIPCFGVSHDEVEVIKEIRALSPAAKGHLQHVYRNGLQSVSGLIELKELDRAKDEIHDIAHKLRRLGL